MDWVDRPQNCKGLYGILKLLQGSHLDNFPLKTLKLDWVAFHSVTFQLKFAGFLNNLINIRNSQSSHVFAMDYSLVLLCYLPVFSEQFDLDKNHSLSRVRLNKRWVI